VGCIRLKGYFTTGKMGFQKKKKTWLPIKMNLYLLSKQRQKDAK